MHCGSPGPYCGFWTHHGLSEGHYAKAGSGGLRLGSAKGLLAGPLNGLNNCAGSSGPRDLIHAPIVNLPRFHEKEPSFVICTVGCVFPPPEH